MITSCRIETPTVLAQRTRQHCSLPRVDFKQDIAARGIPNPQPAIYVARNDALAVGAHCARRHVMAVFFENQLKFTGYRIPYAQGSVRGTGDDALAIWSDGASAYRLVMTDESVESNGSALESVDFSPVVSLHAAKIGAIRDAGHET